mgnify:CR=1 FL=1|tara:strand:+ start:284 stop:781 length:498 start_codon:yes stop_codon:yes gene_type:complete
MDCAIDDETRLNFNNMLKESGVENNTNKIKILKHSSKIRDQVSIMMDIKKKYVRLDKKTVDNMIDNKCNWLFSNYTNIFNKLKKGQLNLQILDKFLIILKNIEDGKCDQHEGSVKVGKLLKELYIDSAIRQEKQYDERAKKKKKKMKKVKQNLTWDDYKKLQLNK